MDDKQHLNILAQFRTLENLYKSNVSEEEELVVKCFLLLMRKKNLLLEPSNYNKNIKNIKYPFEFHLIIDKCVESGDNIEIKKLYNEFVQPISNKIKNQFLGSLYSICQKLSDEYVESHITELFDGEIRSTFTSKTAFGTDALQPTEITILLNYFCDTQNTSSYYNPFAGLASLSLNLPHHISYYGEESNHRIWLLGKLRMLIYDLPYNFQYEEADSFEYWKFSDNERFDYICFNPPFNLKINLDDDYFSFFNASSYSYKNNANSFIIDRTFNMLKPNGKMAFIMPTGFLISSQTKDVDLKKFLVQNGYIDKIIALPERIFNHTSIAANLITISKSIKNNLETEFIDATSLVNKSYSKQHVIKLDETLKLVKRKSSELKRKVSPKEIKDNGYNLAVNRYVFEDLKIDEKDKGYLTKLKKFAKPLPKFKPQNERGKFVRIRDLADAQINTSKSFEDVPIVDLKLNSNLLINNSVLLATTWKSLKPTLYIENDSPIYYDSNSIIALEIDQSKIDIEYFMTELQKGYVEQQVDRYRSGISVSRITRNDLLNIEIVVPTLEQQQKRTYRYKESIIEEQKANLNILMEGYGINIADENSFLRHKIAGRLNNLRGSYSNLKNILNGQVFKELPEAKEFKVNEKLKSTLMDYLLVMDRDLKSIANSVKMAGTELNLLKIQKLPINFISFVENYFEELQNRSNKNYIPDISIDHQAVIDKKIKQVIVTGDKEYLHQAFDNILENAKQHAFSSHLNEENIFLIAIRFDFETMSCIIEFLNTGNPMPKGLTLQAFTRKGSKSGENGGDGIGGWFINEVVEKHDGKLGVRKQENMGPFKTIIELTLPIEIKL